MCEPLGRLICGGFGLVSILTSENDACEFPVEGYNKGHRFRMLLSEL